MLILQLSAAHGPQECQIAVKKLLVKLLRSAEQRNLKAEILEENFSEVGLYSAIVEFIGEDLSVFEREWVGTVQWICQSPIRPNCGRKNWFIGISKLSKPNKFPLESEIVYKACKASGPGGQHVNKTDSAIHATHVKSGISVKVQSQRSQFANKKLAQELIALKLTQINELQEKSLKSKASKMHWEVERGNPVKVFKGIDFQ